MISQVQTLEIAGNYGRPILSDIQYKKNDIPKPIVIFCHGYKGFKDWGAWHLVAKKFIEQDYCFIKFNFSHNGGTISQPIDFPDLEAFGQNNYSIELDDLSCVIDWAISTLPNITRVNNKKIILIGHSRGGGIISIKAAEDKRITHAVSWAGVSDFAVRFPVGAALKSWKKDGVAYVENGRTKQQMPHYIQFYNDFIANKERLSIRKACHQMSAKHLIIYGDNDQVVSASEAENMHAWNLESKLVPIENTNHTFDASHPWTDKKLPKALATVIQETLAFIK